jgi:hypothetical protein
VRPSWDELALPWRAGYIVWKNRALQAEAERDRWREVAELHNTEFEAVQARLDAVRALCDHADIIAAYMVPLANLRAVLDGPDQ